MNKYDFITLLQKQLTGNVPPAKVRELTDYYSDYIDMEIKKGKSETDVLSSLGDPRLLAKSIVATEGNAANKDHQGYDHTNYGSGTYSGYDYGYSETENKHQVKKWELTLFTIGLIILVFVVLTIIIRILGFAIFIIAKYLFPLALLAGIIYAGYKLFFGK